MVPMLHLIVHKVTFSLKKVPMLHLIVHNVKAWLYVWPWDNVKACKMLAACSEYAVGTRQCMQAHWLFVRDDSKVSPFTGKALKDA